MDGGGVIDRQRTAHLWLFSGKRKVLKPLEWYQEILSELTTLICLALH